MSFYNSLQSNIGQLQGTGHVVGFEVPFTDAEVGLPPIPGRELHFDNDPLALGSIAVLAGGLYWANRNRQETKDIKSKQLASGRNHTISGRRSVENYRTRSLVGTLAMTAGITGAMLNAAEPHTDKSTPLVDEVAVLLDVGYEGYTEDVIRDGQETDRISAAINTLKDFSLKGVEMEVIAAGENPARLGTISDGSVEDRQSIIHQLTEYTSARVSQKGSPDSGGGDIEGAMNMVDPNADVTLIFTGSLRGETDSDLLDNQAEDGEAKVKVIALGRQGSTVEVDGNVYTTDVEPGYNERYVGASDSYATDDTDELKTIIEESINQELTLDAREESKIFYRLAMGGFISAGFLYAYQLFKDGLRRNRPKKGEL